MLHIKPNSLRIEIGVDIAMAAYTSELGFLAHPVGPHVQSAEMANQAINSLALLSARYTHTAIDTFAMLAASYIYSLCQALDLRVIQVQVQERIQSGLRRLTENLFGHIVVGDSLEELHSLVSRHISQQLCATTTKDSTSRFQAIAESTQAIFVTFFTTSKNPIVQAAALVGLSTIPNWTSGASSIMLTLFDETREAALKDCATPAYLGIAARRIYEHVRGPLQIPLNRGLADYPSIKGKHHVNGNHDHINATVMPRDEELLVGDCVSRIYDSIKSGDLMDAVMECLADVTATEDLSINIAVDTRMTQNL